MAKDTKAYYLEDDIQKVQIKYFDPILILHISYRKQCELLEIPKAHMPIL